MNQALSDSKINVSWETLTNQTWFVLSEASVKSALQFSNNTLSRIKNNMTIRIIISKMCT